MKSEGSQPELAPCAAVAITDDAGRLLLTKRSDDGSWCLPGGRMNVGESLVHCARRECREELGHDVDIGDLLMVLSDPKHQTHTYPNGTSYQFVGVVFRGRLGELVREPDGEVSDRGWFTADDLPSPLMATDAPAIHYALSGHLGPTVD